MPTNSAFLVKTLPLALDTESLEKKVGHFHDLGGRCFVSLITLLIIRVTTSWTSLYGIQLDNDGTSFICFRDKYGVVLKIVRCR